MYTFGKLSRVFAGGKDGNPKRTSPITKENGKKLPTKLQSDLINLVGRKPVVKIWLNDNEVEGLWDTGSMISLINKDLLQEKFPDLKIHSVDEFMGAELKLSAANQTELQIEGIALLDFGVEESEVLFQIPFIVTKEDVKDIIIGYNVIENLVANCGEKVKAQDFLAKIANVSNNKVDVVVNRIRASFDSPEVMGDVKILKDHIVPPNCVHRVKCETKVRVDNPQQSVLFSPEDNLEIINDLNVMESPETVKMGRKQNMFISVHNPSSKSICLKKGTQMGHVYEISNMIPLPESFSINNDLALAV